MELPTIGSTMFASYAIFKEDSNIQNNQLII